MDDAPARGRMAGDAASGFIGGCRMRNVLELVDVDSERLEEVLRRAEQALDEKDSHLIRRLFESYAYVSDLIEDKNTSIFVTCAGFFGSRTEKTKAVVGANAGKLKAALARDDAAADESSADDANSDARRMIRQSLVVTAATACRGLPGEPSGSTWAHPTLRAGDACPACGEGTVYDKVPGVKLVRITGRPTVSATVYQLK